MKDSITIKIKFLINSIIAFIIYPIYKNKFKCDDIWLVGGHLGNIYDDNSKVFFEYLINHEEKKNVFWVLNKGSVAEEQNPYKDQIVYRGSIKNYLYCYKAQCVIVSHCLADVIPVVFKLKKYLKFKAVFLSHGVEGFKKHKIMDDYYNRYFDVVIAASQFERKIKINEFRVDGEKVKVTGVPRFDKLNNDKFPLKKSIFLMLTWRDYLILNKENFRDSQYYRKITSLLKNENLINSLRKNDICINVALHSFFYNYYDDIKDLESEYVKILPRESSIQKNIIENSLYITDYSSVCWDFAYMNKPVIFYHFDLDEYLVNRGTYIDIKNEIFGDVAYTEKELIDYIDYYINNNFKPLSKHRSILEKYIQFKDTKNCRRVLERIDEVLMRRSL